jgi:putative Mg2+ transporter-C (MgtC) family protein
MILDWRELTLRLFLAAVFGAVIGLERERKDWAAGMRTHMMVCVGSALMMIVSSFGFSDTFGIPGITLDPSRVASQIISGIGFIGAGTILFRKPATILGLTTASGLWTVAGIGMATGGGMYFAASAATALALIILWGLQPLQKKFSSKFQQKILIISLKPDANPKIIMDKLLENEAVEYANFSVTKSEEEIIIELRLEKPHDPIVVKILEELHSSSQIEKITWNK